MKKYDAALLKEVVHHFRPAELTSIFGGVLGCNSIVIWNLRLQLRSKLRQRSRKLLGRPRIGQ